MRTTSALLLIAIAAGCTSPARVLTMRGSTPCPPASGAVETWCDDTGACELRITTGGLFTCSGLDCSSAAVVAAEACRAGGVGDAGTMPRGDAAGDASPIGPGSATTYVLSVIEVPEIDARGRLAGMDLDGVVSDGLTERCDDALDYVSPFSGERGVDNQFGATLAPLLEGLGSDVSLEEALRDQIADGSLLLALEVSDRAGDGPVTVRLARAEMASGGAPLLGADGRLLPDQRYLLVEALGSASGTMLDGNLEVILPVLTLPGAPPVVIHDVHVRAALRATGLGDGELGGGIRLDELARSLMEIEPGLDAELLRSVASADLVPDALGERCDAISIGLSFTAVTARTSGDAPVPTDAGAPTPVRDAGVPDTRVSGCAPVSSPWPAGGACSPSTDDCLRTATTEAEQAECWDGDPARDACIACVQAEATYYCTTSGGCDQAYGDVLCCLQEACPTAAADCIDSALVGECAAAWDTLSICFADTGCATFSTHCFE